MVKLQCYMYMCIYMVLIATMVVAEQHVNVRYLHSTNHLNDVSAKYYFFACDVEGATLQWEVNTHSLGGFIQGQAGNVRTSSRSSFSYSAILLSAHDSQESLGQYNFDSLLIVSMLSSDDLEVVCISDSGFNTTSNSVSPAEENVDPSVTDDSGNVVLQYLFSSEIIQSTHGPTMINAFICGVQREFQSWEVDNNGLPFGFSILDNSDRTIPSASAVSASITLLAFLTASEPYTLTTILLLSGSSDVNVTCASGQYQVEHFGGYRKTRPAITLPFVPKTDVVADTITPKLELTTLAVTSENGSLAPQSGIIGVIAVGVVCGGILSVSIPLVAILFIIIIIRRQNRVRSAEDQRSDVKEQVGRFDVEYHGSLKLQPEEKSCVDFKCDKNTMEEQTKCEIPPEESPEEPHAESPEPRADPSEPRADPPEPRADPPEPHADPPEPPPVPRADSPEPPPEPRADPPEPPPEPRADPPEPPPEPRADPPEEPRDEFPDDVFIEESSEKAGYTESSEQVNHLEQGQQVTSHIVRGQQVTSHIVRAFGEHLSPAVPQRSPSIGSTTSSTTDEERPLLK